MTTIREIMTGQAHWLPQTASIAEAAKLMREKEIGFVPVGRDDRLVGMVTDRDIVTRAVADGLDPSRETVTAIMSKKVLYCRDDDDVDAVAENMGRERVRRLPVVDSDKRLVGVVSLGDIAARGSAKSAGEALHEVCVAA
jgi:CBS domain-containing protein